MIGSVLGSNRSEFVFAMFISDRSVRSESPPFRRLLSTKRWRPKSRLRNTRKKCWAC